MENIKKIIAKAFNNKSLIKTKESTEAIDYVIKNLDEGKLKVAEYDKAWHLNTWLKKAILLYFLKQNMKTYK